MVINGSRVALIPGGEPVKVGRTPDSPFEFGERNQEAVSRAHLSVQLDADGSTVHINNLEPTYGTGVYQSPQVEAQKEGEALEEKTSKNNETEPAQPVAPEAHKGKEIDIATVLADPDQIRQVLHDEQVDPAVRTQLFELIVAWRDLDAMRRVNEAWEGEVADQMAALKEKAIQLDMPLANLQDTYGAARHQLNNLARILSETDRSYLAETLPAARTHMHATIDDIERYSELAHAATEELFRLLPAHDQLSEEVIASLRVAGKEMGGQNLETDDDMLRRMSQDPLVRGTDLAAITDSVKSEFGQTPGHSQWHARLDVMRQTMLEGFAADRYASQLKVDAAQFMAWYDQLNQELQMALTHGGYFEPERFYYPPRTPVEEIANTRSLLQATAQS